MSLTKIYMSEGTMYMKLYFGLKIISMNSNVLVTGGGGGGGGGCRVSLTSPGRPTEIAYSWAKPAMFVVGKVRGGMFLLCPRHFLCWAGRVHIVSPLSVRTFLPRRNTNGFRAISFEKIAILE